MLELEESGGDVGLGRVYEVLKWLVGTGILTGTVAIAGFTIDSAQQQMLFGSQAAVEDLDPKRYAVVLRMFVFDLLNKVLAHPFYVLGVIGVLLPVVVFKAFPWGKRLHDKLPFRIKAFASAGTTIIILMMLKLLWFDIPATRIDDLLDNAVEPKGNNYSFLDWRSQSILKQMVCSRLSSTTFKAEGEALWQRECADGSQESYRDSLEQNYLLDCALTASLLIMAASSFASTWRERPPVGEARSTSDPPATLPSTEEPTRDSGQLDGHDWLRPIKLGGIALLMLLNFFGLLQVYGRTIRSAVFPSVEVWFKDAASLAKPQEDDTSGKKSEGQASEGPLPEKDYILYERPDEMLLYSVRDGTRRPVRAEEIKAISGRSSSDLLEEYFNMQINSQVPKK
jgi:hypothetical protein